MRSWPAVTSGKRIRPSWFTGLQGAVDDIDLSLEGIQTGALPIAPLEHMRAGVANVLDEGADRSGTNDSTTAFLNAIATGKNVYAPYGTYLLDANVLKLGSYQTLFGDGYDTELKQNDGSSGTLIQAVSNSWDNPVIGMCVRDLRINGNKQNQSYGTNFGITGSYVIGTRIHNVFVHDTMRTAIYFGGPQSSILGCRVWDVGMSDGGWSASNYAGMSGIVCAYGGVSLTPGHGPERSVVANNQVDNVLEHGIKFYPGGDHSVIEGNVINQTGEALAYGWVGSSIDLWYADFATIHGNTISNSDYMGIAVHNEALSSGNRGIVITSNTVKTVGDQFGISVVDANDVTIAGNTVADADRGGIRISNGKGGAISGNVVSGSGIDATIAGGGIQVSGTSSGIAITGNVSRNNGPADSGTQSLGIWLNGANNCVVTGNISGDDQGTPTQEYGVRISGGGDYNIVARNILRGNGTGATYTTGAGSNNVVTDNVT